jgi:hypothetical protein
MEQQRDPVSVAMVDGAWRLVDGDRVTTIHGRDPQREADRAIADLFRDSEPGLLVVIGLGLGFLLEALDRRGWAGKVLAIEPAPESVQPFLERRDWRSWIAAERLRLLVGPDFAGASDCWRWCGDAATAVHVNPVFARLRPREVERAREIFERIRFDAKANADARREFGGRYLLNTLRNLPAIAAESDVSALVNAAPKVPAIVVAAGPSLDAAIPALARVQESALVIAVDTAARPLLRAGIRPHLVVAVDPSEGNASHLTDLPPCPDTYLVTEGSLDPLALAGFRGRTFVFRVANHEPWPWLRRAGRDAGTLRAWGSVLTTAFDLAVQMGCDPVVFVGADLAYTGGRPYCRGLSLETQWQRRAHWGTPLEAQWREAIDRWPEVVEADIAGTGTRTAPHLVAFRGWLVDQMRADTGRRFVNATGAGILHGAAITQASPAELPTLIPAGSRAPRDIVRARYRPSVAGAAVMDAATRVDDAVLTAWEHFAPGVSRDAVVEVLRSASGHSDTVRISRDASSRGARYADVGLEAQFLEPLAAAMPLVPMRLPAHALERAPAGARLFRFRTTAARIICCALRPGDGAVAENGRPLVRATDLDHVVAGSYSICRDEVHFRPEDDSDPRTNGREYTLLVPPPVAYLEALPLDDILARQL